MNDKGAGEQAVNGEHKRHTEPEGSHAVSTDIEGSRPTSFEGVYSFVFLFTLSLSITGVAINQRDGGISILALAISLFFTLQLLRMYYYLHEFERESAGKGVGHFVEAMQGINGLIERTLRVGLAALLVATPKLVGELAFLPVFLFAAFSVLIVWDATVWYAMKHSGMVSSHPEAWRTALRFYYLDPRIQPEGLGWYFLRELKFWERLFGLLAAAGGYAFIETGNDLILTGFIVPLILYPVLISYGIFRRESYEGNEKLDPWTRGVKVARDRARQIVASPLFPFLVLFDFLFFERGRSMKKSHHQVAAVLALLVVVLGSGFYWTACAGSDEAEFDGETITVATSKNLWCALTLIAHEKDYFAAEGLPVQLRYQAAGRLNLDAVLGGAADIANVVETNLAYQALGQGGDLRVHGKIVSSHDFVVMTREGSQIQTPSDIRGKEVAYAQATGAEAFLFWLLESEEITDTEGMLRPLQPGGLVDFFVGGGADAVVAWEPFASSIKARQPALDTVFGPMPAGFNGIMLVAGRREWINARPGVMDAYDNAMQRAAAFVADSSEQAQLILAHEIGLPLETVKDIWHRFDFTYAEAGQPELQLVQDVIRRIKRYLPPLRDVTPDHVTRYFQTD